MSKLKFVLVSNAFKIVNQVIFVTKFFRKLSRLGKVGSRIARRGVATRKVQGV